MSNDVIVTKSTLKVFEVYRGLARGPWLEPEPNQCFMVVGVATAEDWIECCINYVGEEERSWLETLVHINGPWNYYEVRTD